MAQNARSSALKKISLRPHSEFEVRQKLAKKEFSKADIDDAVEYLYSLKLLDDRAFAKSFIAYRLARPFGFKRIMLELKQKGVDQETITAACAPYQEEFDDEVVVELAQRRAQRYKGIDPQVRKKRVYEFLIRRGFSHQLAYKALTKI